MNENNSVFYNNGVIVLKPKGGINIMDAIKEAIDISKRYNLKVAFDFNGQQIIVDQNSNLEETYNSWNKNSEQARIDYENSPRFKSHIQSVQIKLDNLMSKIDTVNFSDLEQALPFLSQLIKFSDCVGVHYDRELVLQKLSQSGYFAGMNIGESINLNNKDEHGKLLIGHFMKGSHSVLAEKIDQWVEKFVKPSLEEDYENSPRFKSHIQSVQIKLDNLMSKIDTVNFSDLEQALPFLSQLIKFSDCVGVHYDRELVLQKLSQSGYFAGMNIDEAINLNNKDEHGKLLIGHFMNGCPSFLAIKIDQWVEKFVAPSLEEDFESKKR